jgi:Ribonuclease G/E
MSKRRLYIDRSPGERRGVVLLDGRPERLLIERDGEAIRPRNGEVWRGRIRSLSKAFRGAFIDLGLERDGLMKLDASMALSEGASIEAEVAAEGREDKGPTLRLIGPGQGAPGRIAEAPSLEARLKAFAPEAEIGGGEIAREAADLAEEAILATSHMLTRGPILTIERARGMVAIDTDLTDANASNKGVLEGNLVAVREAARLVRLKGLGGLIVIDLAGPAREHARILAEAREAFAADDPGVVLAGVSRLGVLEIARPWRERPLIETLTDRDGRLSARTVAQRLVRELEREGRADPGARLVGVAAPDVAEAATPLVAELGPRFSVAAEVGRDRANTDIRK